MKIKGNFEVVLNPMESFCKGQDGINLARMSIEKTFHGGIQGTSKGEMLSCMTSVKGSAGYVAIEQFTGQVEDKEGSFVLQHSGVLDKGQDRLIVEVVPDSASGELSGLHGRMTISIENGQHFYEFEYEYA